MDVRLWAFFLLGFHLAACFPYGWLVRRLGSLPPIFSLTFSFGVVDYSRVTRVRVLLTFYPTSLRYLRILASLWVPYCDPLLLAYPHLLITCGPFIGFVGFFPVSQGSSCVGVDRHDDYSANSSTSLAQCGFVGGFLTNLAIFALVLVHLGKFGFSSFTSIGNSNAFLCQLSLPIPLFLSPLVSSLGGQSCSPPSLVASVLFALGALLL